MASAINDMYKRLENCVKSLEEDVRKSLDEVTEGNFDETVVALETSKDYHYKEILGQLKQIKDHIKIIAEHNQSLHLLQNKINGTRIDKNYIKKQVETFQKMGMVNRRERKPVRPRETSSMKLLECWEKLMEEQQAKERTGDVFSVAKRASNVRKNKKLVSSTVDTFLESDRAKSFSLDLLIEETTDVEEIPVITKCVSTDCLFTQKTGKSVEASNEALVEDAEEVSSEEKALDSLCTNTTSVHDIEKSDSSDALNMNNESVVDMIKDITQNVSTSEEKPEENTNSKPRIVEVIYKKKANGHIQTHNH